VATVRRIGANPDDDELVSSARLGDRRATEQLLRQHYPRVYGVCRRITGNDADAADAAQNAMIAMVRGLPNFDGRSSFSSWAYRVATNASLDELRRRKRRGVVGLPDDDLAADPTPLDRSLEATVGNRLDADAALARIPEEFRIPVVMRDLLDMEYAEIAETLGIPAGTVRSRIARGRAALARVLGNQRPTGARRSGTETDDAGASP
jgi:RNA polymerase sigma-70 factor, ECF subfamily